MKSDLKLASREYKLCKLVPCVWTDNTICFVNQILNASANYNNDKSNHIVCVVNEPEVILENNKSLQKLHAGRKLFFVKGNSRDLNTLENANVHEAGTVVLLSEDNTVASDEKTLLRALAISRFCREKAVEEDILLNKTTEYQKIETGKYVDSIYIIAEITDPQFKRDLIQADVNEVVISSVLAKGTIIQSVLNHGVSKVLDEALAYNDFNEFYLVDLMKPEHAHLRGKTYDELLLPLRKQKIQLIAIKVIYHDEFGDIVLDDDIIQRELQKDGLTREVILNPITDEEIKRETDNDDHLMVLATSREDLERQLQEVRFN